MEVLTIFTLIMLMITGISMLNEKVFKMPNDIALLLFSTIIAIILGIVNSLTELAIFDTIINLFRNFQFEAYLLDGVLCYMLFAGAGQVHFNKFTTNLKNITMLALATTAISSIAYGLLFFIITSIFKWNISIWVCILLGCIIAPTDPIAATGIMNKLGLSKNITTIIESESLFNDGMGVVLFAFIKGIIENIGQENFFFLMIKEAFGAAIVAILISVVLFSLIKSTKDPANHIIISILTVSLAYLICEICGFSGAIASVVCGMYFSYQMDKIHRYRSIVDPEDMYEKFWEIIDHILNSILFILIGFSTLQIDTNINIIFIAFATIICSLTSRAIGVSLPSKLLSSGTAPGGYNILEYTLLMTWSALKGGLSLALVLSTKKFLPDITYTILINAVYITIIFTVVVQGLTTKKMYHFIERHKALRIKRGE